MKYNIDGCEYMPKSKDKKKNSEKIVKCPLCKKTMEYIASQDNWKCKDCNITYDYAYEVA